MQLHLPTVVLVICCLAGCKNGQNLTQRMFGKQSVTASAPETPTEETGRVASQPVDQTPATPVSNRITDNTTDTNIKLASIKMPPNTAPPAPTNASSSQAKTGLTMPANMVSPVTASISSSAPMTKEPSLPVLITLKPGEDLMKEIANSQGNVVLDFYADWCGPCKTQAKILHELTPQAAKNKVRIIKVNIEQHPNVAKQMNIKTLPTLVVMKQGQVVKRKTGLTSKSQLKQWIN